LASAARARADPLLAAANLELAEEDLATIEGKDCDDGNHIH
jgi:hypothetical protein